MSRNKDRFMIVTVQQHILQEQQRFPGASGEFSWLLSGVTLATKMIQAQVRRAGMLDILGEAGETNVQGEKQQKLDIYANEALMHALSKRASIGVLASEENEEPVVLDHLEHPEARYAVVFDPLDGSSNIDVNVSVGTTFSIMKRPANGSKKAQDWLLQPGTRQLAAGYVLYGSSTMLVYSAGNGVHGFTLDPAIGVFVLTHPSITMPTQGKYYSCNEAFSDTWPIAYQKYVEKLRHGSLGHRYATRYIGSMVSDVHRTLLKGGVFLYPPTADYPRGKLRLLYEANPIAFLVEQAGGVATNGRGRVLDIQPEAVHERTPLILGGKKEMEEFQRFVQE
jgi:fructose-1,6-bisphosphatase I